MDRRFESVFLGAVRVARSGGERLGEGGSIAFVLSSSVRAPLAGLAISNGLRPGLAMVAKTLADELGPRGIRVNGLLPGRVEHRAGRASSTPDRRPGGGAGEGARRRSRCAATAARGVRRGGGVPAQPGVVIRHRA